MPVLQHLSFGWLSMEAKSYREVHSVLSQSLLDSHVIYDTCNPKILGILCFKIEFHQQI